MNDCLLDDAEDARVLGGANPRWNSDAPLKQRWVMR